MFGGTFITLLVYPLTEVARGAAFPRVTDNLTDLLAN